MRKGFTLVEMLVVIGIIAILIGASIGGFSAMTKTADRARSQELVSNVASALTEYFNRNGAWPKVLLNEAATGEGKLTAEAAYPLANPGGDKGKSGAPRGVLSLAYDLGSRKLIGLDRLGIVDHYAQSTIRSGGAGVGIGTKVKSGGSVEDHILRFAIDVNGDGIIDGNEGAVVGGVQVSIRATAAVWSCGRDGVISPYPYGGGGAKAGGGANKGKASSGKTDDVWSWTPGQTRNVK